MGQIYKKWKDKRRVKQRKNKARNRGKKGDRKQSFSRGEKAIEQEG